MIEKTIEGQLPLALTRSSRLFVMVVGVDGICRYTNELLQTKISHTHGYALPYPASALFAAEDVTLFNAVLEKCRTGQEPVQEVTFRIPVENMPCRHTAWEISRLDNENILCVGHDITRQKEIERDALLKQQMLDSVEQAIMVTGADNKIVFWNRHAEQLFGWPHSEVIGKDVIGFVHPSVKEEGAFLLTEIKNSEKGWTGEFMMQNNTGHTFPAYCITSPIKDETGTTIGIVGTAMDLTERKKTEMLLDDSRRKLEMLSLIADKTVNGIVMSDAEGCVEWVNNRFSELFGYDSFEVVGKRPMEMLSGPGSDPEVLEQINNCVAQQQPYDVEIIHYRKNGEPFWIRVQGQPLLSSNGELLGFLDVVADITEQKTWEEQLLFQAYLLDNVQQAVVVTDNDWNITYWNKYAERLYGWEKDEIRGKNIRDLVCDTADDSEFRSIQRRISAGFVHSGEIEMKRKNGESFPAHCINSLIYDKTGQPIGCMAVTFDTTEQRTVEMERRKGAELLMKQYRKLKQFAHINAHDLRAPLTNILSITHLLTSNYQLSDEERKTYLRGLEDSAKQMDGVVRKLNSVLQGYEMDVNESFFGQIVQTRRKIAVVVDDDPIQNAVNKKLITTEFPNYDVITYTNPEAALTEIVHNKITPDILFLDLNMPRMTGWEFLENLKDRPVYFDIQILTSSVDQNDFLRAKTTPHVTGVTSKPLQKDLLEALL